MSSSEGKSYRAVVGLTYPHPNDVPAVRAAGGLSALAQANPEAFARVTGRMIHRAAGESCDDVPETSVAGLLARGRIEVVEPVAPTLSATLGEYAAGDEE